MNQQDKEDYQEHLNNMSDMQLLTKFKNMNKSAHREQYALAEVELTLRGLV